MKSRFFSAVVLAAAMMGAVGAHAGRVWNFIAYSNSTNEPMLGGEFHLTDPDEDGNARVSIFLPRNSMACVRGRVPAKVEETESATVVTIPPMMHGCEPMRYTFFKDGSGGFGETMYSGEWKKNKRTNGLTPKN